MTDEFEQWMAQNLVKRVVRMDGGFGVYLAGTEPFGTGVTIEAALLDARGRA